MSVYEIRDASSKKPAEKVRNPNSNIRISFSNVVVKYSHIGTAKPK